MMTVKNSSKFSILYLILASFTLCNTMAWGQNNKKPWQVNLSLGTMVYQGDLCPTAFGEWNTLKPAIGVALQKDVSDKLAIKAELGIGGLACDESIYTNSSFRTKRALNFSTSVVDFGGHLIYKINGRGYVDDMPKITPYLGIGLNVSILGVTRDYSKYDYNFMGVNSSYTLGLEKDVKATMPSSAFTIPFTAGLSFNLNSDLSLFTELTFHNSFSDYIDGFKYAANSSNPDNYYHLKAGISFRLFKDNGIACPTYKR